MIWMGTCTYVTRSWGIHDERWTRALQECGFAVQALSLDRDGLDIRELNSTLAAGEGPILAGPIDSITRHISTQRPLIGLSWGFDLLDMRDRGDDLSWMSHVSGLVVDSPETLDIAHAAGLPSTRIAMIPWGVDLQTFSPHGSSPTPVDLGFPSGSTIIITLRAHEPRYRNDDVIAGFALAAQQDPTLVLVMGHSGSETDRLRGLVHDHGLDERVSFIGALPETDLPALLRSAHMYVSASEVDGTSVTLLQAMASGTPVIASDTVGNRAWVSPGLTGRLFRTGDVSSLAEALTATSDSASHEDTVRMARAARLRVEGDADWSKNHRRLLPLLTAH